MGEMLVISVMAGICTSIVSAFFIYEKKKSFERLEDAMRIIEKSKTTISFFGKDGKTVSYDYVPLTLVDMFFNNLKLSLDRMTDEAQASAREFLDRELVFKTEKAHQARQDFIHLVIAFSKVKPLRRK